MSPGPRKETTLNNPHEYRELAEAQRRLAETAELPNVRMMHTAAARRWDEIAQELERSAGYRKTATVAEPALH
jgi:hypothetical protein